MTVYIALLRGINVGGKNKIKMADLKYLFETMDFNRVQTYIQSGNVLFEADENEEVLRKNIEDQIQKDFGLSFDVILRTAAELEQIIHNCPFSEEEIFEAESTAAGECLYVSLLTHTPAKEKIDWINALNYEGEKVRIVQRDVYLLFSNSIRNSKLGNSLQKLDMPATARNWKTISKLNVLAKAMQ